MLRLTALHDLCTLAEEPCQAAHRRQALFADESGAAWHLPVQVCIGLVRSQQASREGKPDCNK